MNVPNSFNKLGGALHQDVYLCATEGLAVYCLGFLTIEDQAEVEPFLRRILAGLNDAEIKGLLNRTSTDLRLPGKKARALLEDVLSELEGRRDKA